MAPMPNKQGMENASDSPGKWRSQTETWPTILAKDWQDEEDMVHLAHKKVQTSDESRIFEDVTLNESMLPTMDGKYRGVPVQNARCRPCTGPFNMHGQCTSTCLPEHSTCTCWRDGESSL
mmetsp:Transcript_540/g.3822  ORF Transcript_540/g.3822 Transcript_540/m.3822 type:complete len:120 (+) Transcript_540:52-411(+)